MIALGYPTMADAADAAPLIVDHRPTACEGLDRRIVDVVRRTRGDAAVPLAARDGWMFVELVGDDLADLRVRADALLAAGAWTDSWCPMRRSDGAVEDPGRRRGPGEHQFGRPAYPGWEDAAVPAEHLGSYLRDFDRLLDDHGLDGLPYGHFGDGAYMCASTSR